MQKVVVESFGFVILKMVFFDDFSLKWRKFTVFLLYFLVFWVFRLPEKQNALFWKDEIIDKNNIHVFKINLIK